MSSAALPYLKDIADALKGLSGGTKTASAAKISSASVKASAHLDTSDIVENLDKGLMTDFSEESSQLRISALAMLKASLVSELRSAYMVTVQSQQKSAFELIHEQLVDLRQYHIREILSHLHLRKLNEGQPNEQTYLAVDIGFVGDSFGSFGGTNPGGGGGGIDLARVWQSLKNNTDYPDELINAHHIPIGTGLSIDPNTGLINAAVSGTIPVSQGGTGLTSIPIYSMLYASAANTLATLAPNTAATKKFLTMTGVGGVGAAPSWATMSFSDLPDMFLLGNQVASSAARGMLKGVSSISRQLSGETPEPGSTTSGSVDTSLFEWDSTYSAWHFKGNLIVDGFGSFGGNNSGSGSGIDLARVWQSLTNNTDMPDVAINPAHMPVASANSIGGIKVGNNLTITDGVLSATGHAYTTAEILALIGDRFVLNTSDTMSGSLGIGTYLTTGTYLGVGTYLTVGTNLYLGGTSNPYFYWDSTNNAVHFTGNFVVDGFGSFGGAQSGTSNILLAIWKSLTNDNSLSSYDGNTKIAAAHIPIGNGLTTSNGNIIASIGTGLQFSSGAVAISDIVVRTSYVGGLKLVICNYGQVPQPGDSGYDAHALYFEKLS